MLELPAKSPLVWQKFFTENKPLVFRYVVKQLSKAIPEGKETVDLFKFADGHVTNLTYDNYGYMLDQCMTIFVREEDYEYADKVKKLIDQYHIERLLKDV
jgi:hypothetical protein